MTSPRHVYDIYIKATPQRVWQALSDPALTARYFFGNTVESTFAAGAGYRYLRANGDAVIEGVIEEAEPGRRLAMTFRLVDDSALAAEPPSRVEWTLTPAGEVTRLTLVHGDLLKSPRTWETTRLRWLQIMGGMKTLLETGEELGEVREVVDPDTPAAVEGGWHRAQGIAANGATWDWLEKPARTAADDEEMTMAAYASAHHWSQAVGRTPANEVRAMWMLSRTWVVRGNGELALHYADVGAAACAAAGLEDFDLAYAHEARARALACLGRGAEAADERARAATIVIDDDESRNIFESDLAAEPWFGV